GRAAKPLDLRVDAQDLDGSVLRPAEDGVHRLGGVAFGMQNDANGVHVSRACWLAGGKWPCGDRPPSRARGPAGGHVTGAPARAAMTPSAPAPTTAATTPRRSPSSHAAASASSASCHRWASARPSGIVAPAIAPMAAGPAPVRNARTRALPRSWSNRDPPASTNANDGANATSEASSPPPTPAAAQPSTATVRTAGPGVTCPSAPALRNWALVIQ